MQWDENGLLGVIMDIKNKKWQFPTSENSFAEHNFLNFINLESNCDLIKKALHYMALRSNMRVAINELLFDKNGNFLINQDTIIVGSDVPDKLASTAKNKIAALIQSYWDTDSCHAMVTHIYYMRTAACLSAVSILISVVSLVFSTYTDNSQHSIPSINNYIISK